LDLLNHDSEKYGSEFNEHILEQWKACVEMANSNSERRLTSNNIFIVINAAIIALTSFAPDYKSIVMSLVGIVVSAIWINSIKSYKELNRVKYQIINELEGNLPASPYKYEWYLINKEGKYKRFTILENILPCIFIVLYILCIIAQIFHLICPAS
jgi:hypothetical protein